MVLILWLLCYCGASVAGAKFFNSYAGPYWFEFEPEFCRVQGDLSHVIVKAAVISNEYNRTIGARTIKASVNFTRDLERGLLTVHYDIAKWDPVSGWREHFFIWNLGEFCQFIEKTTRDTWERTRKQFSPQMPAGCPIPKGERLFTSVRSKTYLAALPVLPYGRYRSYLFLRHAKTKDILGAICNVAKVIPRET